MIRCTNCQTINPSDAVICSNCSSLLEWMGVRVDPAELAAPPATEAAAEGEPASTPAEGLTAETAQPEPEPRPEPSPATPVGDPEAAPERAATADARAASDADGAGAPAAAEARFAAEARAAEEARAEAASRAAEQARVAAETKAAEEARRAADARAAEEARVAAEANARAAEEARLAAEARAAEEARSRAAARDQPPLTRPGARPDDVPLRTPTTSMPDEADQPDERKPVRDIPARPRPKPEPSPEPEPIPAAPGEIICRFCRTPNDPSKTFCRKCGKNLAAEPSRPPTVPWYRRIFAGRSRAMQAGERPTRMGESGEPRPGLLARVVPFVLIALLAFAITSVIVVPGVRTSIGDFVTDLRLRLLPEFVPVHPVRVQGPGRDPNIGKLAGDNDKATYWLADPAAGQPTLTVDIGDTINLGALVVHSGSSTERDFTRHRRPRTLELTFPGTDRPAVPVPLTNTPEPQPVSLDVRGVDTVVIRVVDWFPGGDAFVAIREIEFQERR